MPEVMRPEMRLLQARRDEASENWGEREGPRMVSQGMWGYPVQAETQCG